MNRKKIMALLLTTFLISNLTTNFVKADINDSNYKSQYVNMLQSEPISENIIPKSEITATATSAQSGEDASKAIDGNTSTLWHTPWAGVDVANNPQSLTLNLGKVRNVSSIQVTPRQSGNNGIIKDYKIYAGDKIIAEGTWTTNATTKYVVLPEPVSTDSIRIEALSSVGDSLNRFVSIAEVDVYEAKEAPTKLATASNITITNGSGGDLTEDLSSITSLEEGTAIIRFTTTGSGIQSLFSISNNTRANEHFHVYINGGQVGYELRKQSGNVSTGVISSSLNRGINTIAFRAQKNGGYSIYLNGEQILNNNLATANFLSALEGANTFKLGTTDRSSGSEYNFTGKIDFFEVYNQPLADRYIKEITGQTKATDLPLPEGTIKTSPISLFKPGDLGSPNFRIPTLNTTKEGTVLATIDVRNNGGHDAPGNNIDVGLKRSTDGGVTWDEGKVILNYPGASAAIDTSMVQDEETGRIFLIVTHFAEGYGYPNCQIGSGYKEVNGTRYLKLLDASGAEYTVRDNGVVYDSNNQQTNYTVDQDQNLFQNGTKVGNILLSSSPLKIIGTSFISMIYSDDDGVTWSKPIDLNKSIKADWMKFFGTGPGRGIQVKNGEYAGRLIFPIYLTNSSGFQSSAVIYSDDNGTTWNIGETATDGRVMSNGQAANAQTITGDSAVGQLTEAQVVEMPNGQLKMFMRNTGGNSGKVRVATSFDGGATWDNDVVRDESLTEPYCQLSVINYSQKIDGKDALIFSNPNATSRSNGTVRVGLITENGTYTNGEPRYDIEWKYSKVVAPGTFAYSCLSEMPNGEIGLFYEGTGSQEMSFTRMNVEYLKADLLADAPSAKISSITSLDEQTNYLPGDTANLKITFDQTVSLFGNRSLNLIIDGKEVSGEVTKISGTEYKITVKLPQDISAGTHKVSVKAKTDLEIVNVVGKIVSLSEDIQTDSTIIIDEVVVSVDKSELSSEINSAIELIKESYTVDSWKAFEEALKVAEVVLEDVNATQDQVNEAKSNLVTAKNNLVAINKIFEYVNLEIVNGSDNGNIGLEVEDVKNLEQGTIIMRFDNKGGTAFQSLLSFSNNTQDRERFYLYITANNRIGFERQSADGNKSYYASNLTLNEGDNTIALKVEKNVGYSIFVNGVKALTQADTATKFIKGISGLNSVNIGKSDRATLNENPFTGQVDFVSLYENVMSDTELIEITGRVEANKSELQQLVYSCDAFIEADYTVDSWNKLLNALSEANNVLKDVHVTQEQVDLSKNNLKSAIDTLIEAEKPAEDTAIFNLKAEDTVTEGEAINIKLSVDEIAEHQTVQSIDSIFTYDVGKFELGENAITAVDGDKTFISYSETTPGTVRVIITSLGEAVVSGTDIANIKLTAKNSLGATNLSMTGKYSDGIAIKDIKASNVEVNIIEKIIPVDKAVLQSLVTECLELKEDTYTVDSWSIFVEALDGARAMLANGEATQAQVNLALEQLKVAKDGLVEKEEVVKVYKRHLEIAVEVAKGITDFTDIVPAVKAEFDSALAEASQLLSDENASQEQVNNSFDRLSKAIHMLEFKGNKEQLMNLLNQIEALDSNNYTKESWDALQAVINRDDIKEVVNNENVLQADIEKAYNDIFAAFRGLVEASEQVNKDRLNSLIEKVKNLNGDEYIKETWNIFFNALSEAKEISISKDATQAEVDKSYETLLRAYLGLRLKPSKDKLQDLINKAETLDSSKYTVKSYKALQKALKAAKAVYEDDKADDKDIANAEKELEVAIANLTVKAEENGQNSANSNNSNTGNSNNNSTGKGNSKLPVTGGKSAAAVGLLGAISSTIGAIMFKRKKNR